MSEDSEHSGAEGRASNLFQVFDVLTYGAVDTALARDGQYEDPAVNFIIPLKL